MFYVSGHNTRSPIYDSITPLRGVAELGFALFYWLDWYDVSSCRRCSNKTSVIDHITEEDVKVRSTNG